MRTSPKLSEIVGWLGIATGLAVLFKVATTGGSWPLVAITAVITATAVIVFRRSLAGLSQLQSLLLEGRPAPMLRIARRRLRYRGGGRNRAPLLIYQAAAYSMTGDFEKGLLALDDIDVPADFPEDDRESWAFAYASTRFSCLLFAEKIEAARVLYDDELAAYASRPGLATTIEAMEGELFYCEGEHIKAERILETLVSETKTAPAARGVFLLFPRPHLCRSRSDGPRVRAVRGSCAVGTANVDSGGNRSTQPLSSLRALASALSSAFRRFLACR